ncbi:uncharacterized protein F5147DRAFT_776221 [Suillus discolor]|uniref:Uncharacterized protein n=1 Tax=Suillus discolor TaxID=1912936 RepID=A0A9P7F308_9AGAM|nr:uncharacterized protein F5147DRAFT_776221 [Suillus discolor]KAG2102873.1 hypothetical protein F5147DRAFT_776221 [Suillus discolor]
MTALLLPDDYIYIWVCDHNLLGYHLRGQFMAVLNDYDLLSFKRDGPRGLRRTGTVSFMVVDLLMPDAMAGKVKRVYAYNAELFIWVLTWVCLRYEEGKLLLLAVFSPEILVLFEFLILGVQEHHTKLAAYPDAKNLIVFQDPIQKGLALGQSSFCLDENQCTIRHALEDITDKIAALNLKFPTMPHSAAGHHSSSSVVLRSVAKFPEPCLFKGSAAEVDTFIDEILSGNGDIGA